MTKAFVFAGNDTVGNMVADRLCGAGWQRVGDAGAADAVLTYFTTQTALSLAAAFTARRRASPQRCGMR